MKLQSDLDLQKNLIYYVCQFSQRENKEGKNDDKQSSDRRGSNRNDLI